MVVGSTDDHESVIKTVLLLRPFLFGCHDLLIMTLFLLLNTVVACLCRVPPPLSLSLSLARSYCSLCIDCHDPLIVIGTVFVLRAFLYRILRPSHQDNVPGYMFSVVASFFLH